MSCANTMPLPDSHTARCPTGTCEETLAEAEEPPDRNVLSPVPIFSKKTNLPVLQKASLLTKQLENPPAPTRSKISFGLGNRKPAAPPESIASPAELQSDYSHTSGTRSNTPTSPEPPYPLAFSPHLRPKIRCPSSFRATDHGSDQDKKMDQRRGITFMLPSAQPTERKPSTCRAPSIRFEVCPATLRFDETNPRRCPSFPGSRSPSTPRPAYPAAVSNSHVESDESEDSQDDDDSDHDDASDSNEDSDDNSEEAEGDDRAPAHPGGVSLLCKNEFGSKVPACLTGPHFHAFAGSDSDNDPERLFGGTHRRLTVKEALRDKNGPASLGIEADEDEDEDEDDNEDGGSDDGDDEDEDEDDEDEDADESDEDVDVEESVTNEEDAGADGDGEDDGDEDDVNDDSDDEERHSSSVHPVSDGEGSVACSFDDPPAFLFSARSSQLRVPASAGVPVPHSYQPHSSFRRRGGNRKQTIAASFPALPPHSDLLENSDFVCGTPDEDREQFQIAIDSLRQSRPQTHHDIDPTFPFTDTELSGGESEAKTSSSRMLYRKLSRSDRSPPPPSRRGSAKSSRRVSPVPVRAMPRDSIFANHRRYHSPAPGRQYSPAWCNRAFTPVASPMMDLDGGKSPYPHPGLANRPVRVTSSVPKALCRRRNGKATIGFRSLHATTNDDERHPNRRPAIDIVKGLEAKRARRRLKMWQRAQQRPQSVINRQHKLERERCAGRGVENMRKVGLGCMGRKAIWPAPTAAQAETVKKGFVLSC